MDDEDRSYLFRFLGYGNPASPLWFVGIEEGGEQGQLPVRGAHRPIELPSGRYFHDPKLPTIPSDARPWRIWRKYRDIAERAGTGSNYFISNMAPLGRPSTNVKLMGVDGASYRDRVRRERIPALRELAGQFQPRAIVFHGSGAWRDYQVRESFGVYLQKGQIQFCDEQRLLFTPFLTQGLSNADQDRVVEILKGWMDAPQSSLEAK